MKRVLILIPLLLFSFFSSAQKSKDFPVDTATFVNDLYSFMENMMGDQDKQTFQEFGLVWDSLSYDYRISVIGISNLMIKRGCRPKPQFTNYLVLLKKFFLEKKLGYGYLQWQDGYRALLSDENTLIRQIDQFVSLTSNILDGSYLFKGATVQWQARQADYQFYFDGKLKIVFNQAEIVCRASRDSIEIHDASGYVNPYTSEWIGSHGIVNWSRAGYSPDELYAELSCFRISLQSSGYIADTVMLYHKALFDKPITGRLEDKVLFIREPSAALYPQFYTYQNSYKLPGFYNGINYYGGLSMRGANLAGTGNKMEPAILEIFSNDTLRVKLKSEMFLFNLKTIRSNDAEVSVYLSGDSVYHPDLVFNYNIQKEECRFTKSDRYTSQGPYLDSYHNIDMNFDELYWKRDQNIMKLQAMTGTSIGRATFESESFFNYDYFLSLQGMDWEHPLVQLWRFSEMVGGRDFSVSAYASYLGYDV